MGSNTPTGRKAPDMLPSATYWRPPDQFWQAIFDSREFRPNDPVTESLYQESTRNLRTAVLSTGIALPGPRSNYNGTPIK
jgi:hypothetical protein